MIGVGLGEEFDAKIIDGESESGTTVDVAPETRSLANGKIAERSKMCLELVVRQDGGFFEAIHAFPDFNIYVSFGVEVGVGEIIFGNNFGCEIPTVDLHVLEDDHVGNEKEVFQVAGAIAGAEVGVGDGAVEVQFGVGKTDGGRTNILVRIEAVAANSHADAVEFGFTRAHGAHEICIGNLAASWDLMREDEDHRVVADDVLADGPRFGETLGATAPLVGEQFGPDSRVGAAKEGINVFDLAGVRIVHFAGDGGVVTDGLDEMGALMRARIKVKTTEPCTWAFA